MAKSLPTLVLWIAVAFVAEASRSSVSVDQDTPMGGSQMLQIESKGRKEVVQKHTEGMKAKRPPCRADATIFHFEDAKVTMNNRNLGGQGPGRGSNMRFENVGNLSSGESFDMTVETLNEGYEASNPFLNNLRGKSGQVNCKAGSEARLKFTMVAGGTDDPVELPAFYFSVYDIDQNGYMAEEMTVSGYDEITIPDDAEYTVKDTDTGKMIRSQKFGRLCDNPEEPTNLHVINCYGDDKVDQRKRAFTMLFKDKSSFEMTFKVDITRQNPAVFKQGRNLLFSGPTNLIEPCEEPVCIPDVVKFDLENAKITHKNLGGVGPAKGEESLLYSGIGEMNGRPFDMKVVTHNDDYRPGKPDKSGLKGKSGQINVKVDHHAELTFSFVDQESGDPVTLPAFYISIFDIDFGPVADEIIMVRGFEEINIPEGNEYTVVDGPDPGGKTVTATQEGYLCDNPTDPDFLGVVKCKGHTVDTRKRSFCMLFKHKSSFDVTFMVPSRAGTEELQAKLPNLGRNMQFAGTSALSGECS